MADENSNNSSTVDGGHFFSDNLNQQQTNSESVSNQFNKDVVSYLLSIENSLKKMLEQGARMSQSEARNGLSSREDFMNRERIRRENSQNRGNSNFRSGGINFNSDNFTDGLYKEIMEGFFGSDFRENIGKAADAFAREFGLNLETVRNDLGKELGKNLVNVFKNTEQGKRAMQSASKIKDKILDRAKSSVESGLSRYDQEHGLEGENSFVHKFRSGVQAAKRAAQTGGSDEQTRSNQSTENDVSASEAQTENPSAFDQSLRNSTENLDRFRDALNSASDALNSPDQSQESTPITDQATSEENIANQSASDTVTDNSSSLQQQVQDVIDSARDAASETSSNSNINTDSDVNVDDIVSNSNVRNGLSRASERITQAANNGANKITGGVRNVLGNGAGDAVENILNSGVSKLGGALGKLSGSVSSVASGVAGAGASASAAGAALAGLGPLLVSFAGPLIAATAATWLIDKAFETLTPAIEGTKKALAAMSKAANRGAESRKANIDAEKTRMMADVKLMIEEPFEILQKAANELYSAWDSNIRQINQTQGYTKDDLHQLISSYSQRLRDEGMSDVISSASITESLTKVLNSGMSGVIAEEFAYLATKLNAAIPTQDFFSFADQYTALAGTAIQMGMSQTEAIDYANKQLTEFASGILYANRNLTGGFTTGLKDATSLFDDAVKIAQTSRSTNVSEIGGVLSAISAAVGSVAPDLASGIIDAVTKAATGGNSSEIVALRAITGINASNTDFLRQVAENPQKVFSALFENLSKMQNMSNDAYMEVAEGLSSVFGVSMDAFARVDFNYLATQISSMNLSSNAIKQNLELLASGESTTSSEALRMQQINQYMIDEGLAYVMDSEAARAIQQHMWDEQLARQMQEATYGVELQGAALEFLEGIQSTIRNILGFLNPFMLVNKSIQTLGTWAEGQAQRADTERILQAVKVGKGRQSDLVNLTTTGRDLKLVGNLAQMITGSSAYTGASNLRKAGNMLTSLFGASSGTTSTSAILSSGKVISAGSEDANSGSAGGRKSQYTWGITKSQASSLAGKIQSAKTMPTVSSSMSKQQSEDAAKERAQELLRTKMSTALDMMGQQDKFGKLKFGSYEDWEKSAKKKVGAKNWQDALDASGLSESDLKTQFENYQAKEGAEIQQARLENEEDFWQAGKDFWRADEFRVKEFAFWETTMAWQINELTRTTEIRDILSNTTNKILLDTKKELIAMHKDWTDYYIRYTTYGTGGGEKNAAGRKTYDYSSIQKIANKEKEESYDAVHALAEALNKNIVDLHDPQVQTNALLAKILLVAEALLQQNQTADGSPSSTLATLTQLATGKL